MRPAIETMGADPESAEVFYKLAAGRQYGDAIHLAAAKRPERRIAPAR